VPTLADTPNSANTQAHSSASVASGWVRTWASVQDTAPSCIIWAGASETMAPRAAASTSDVMNRE
jgi:hypothetical protein